MARYGDLDALAVKWTLASPTQKQNFREIIEKHPTADVATKSEVEELTRENKSLAKTVNEASELIRSLRSKVKKSKTEVAREIFAEIESNFHEDDFGDLVIDFMEYHELKKKYTGEQT